MNKQTNIKKLISIMQCPSCKVRNSLQIEDGAYDGNISVPLWHKTIFCELCNEHYPITDDQIPIMWSSSLKRAFSDINQIEETDDMDMNISANMKVYDDISDNYKNYTRKSSDIGNRICNAVKNIFHDNKTEELFHLDYACGPGHVIEWLKPFGFQQIGLDVSLVNLRNARNNTDCLVVCGDACNMPFANETFNIVTESSGLHHILDWKSALSESCRICREPGGIIIDSEPSDIQMAWSKLAIAFFNVRFPIYKVLSYFIKGKYIFRNTEKAKLNLKAEIHHQPGTGFPLDVLKNTIEDFGFRVKVVVSPTVELNSCANPTWKSIILNLLSARNPWNPNYGSFTAIATIERGQKV
jgi:ubiquinone/menaquinone biosynthesis C-methylase UbiE/uncharacterized protein YbaR (Trm112 family)